MNVRTRAIAQGLAEVDNYSRKYIGHTRWEILKEGEVKRIMKTVTLDKDVLEGRIKEDH